MGTLSRSRYRQLAGFFSGWINITDNLALSSVSVSSRGSGLPASTYIMISWLSARAGSTGRFAHPVALVHVYAKQRMSGNSKAATTGYHHRTVLTLYVAHLTAYQHGRWRLCIPGISNTVSDRISRQWPPSVNCGSFAAGALSGHAGITCRLDACIDGPDVRRNSNHCWAVDDAIRRPSVRRQPCRAGGILLLAHESRAYCVLWL